MKAKEKLLQLENISVHYGGVRALDGASLQFDEGEIVALMGPNGAGKSTVLKSIFGLAPITSGQILLEGDRIYPISHEMAERGIAFVPQGRRVFTHLTVEENLEIGAYAVKSKSEIKRRHHDMLKLFPALVPKLKQKSGTLSGGQQQMVAIARGLMSEPRALLLDEPSLGLSPKLVKEVFKQIKEINIARKTAIIVVEHNIKSLLEIADRAYVLDRGKIAATGTAKEISSSDILERVFMGKM